MKRKKPPIALISVLVVALLGIIIASPGFAFFNKSAEEQEKVLQQQAMDQAKAQAAKEPAGKVDAPREVAAMKSALQKGSATPKPSANKLDEHGEQARKHETPSMVMPLDEVRKPRPNDNAPSSQWYSDKK